MLSRRILILLSICFSAVVCNAQKLELQIDSIDEVMERDSHGDSIRAHYSSTFFNYDNSPGKKKSPVMVVFYSNRLVVNNKVALKKIPELLKYKNPGKQSFMQPYDGYAGKFAIPIFDSAGFVVTVNGIHPGNAQQYQFRVLQDSTKEVLPWTTPKLFRRVYLMTFVADPNKKDSLTAYLGKFKAPWGKALTIQIREVSTPDTLRGSVSAYWVRWQPKVVGVFNFAELPDFLNIFKIQWTSPLEYDNKDWAADTTYLKLRNKFKSNENNLIFYLDDVIRSKNVIEYSVVSAGDSTKWRANDFDFNLIWLKDLAPGDYKLKIRYAVQRDKVTTYTFSIQAAWYQTIWAKAGLALLLIIAVGFVWLLWRSRQQAEKLKVQSTQKQLVQTELKSIRSQFNPHFVFNALSSIQGLITRNDAKSASKYLIEFSNLMRDSLKASDRELVSISTEVKILENYLALEKLRFGFEYQITVNEEIDGSAIEIPSLFLQPLVENAVKHGISHLHEDGRLSVLFQRSGDDMLVSVNDNGEGFKEGINGTGYGLQLTRDRMKLLNQTLNGQLIDMSINRIDNQTQILIQFKNWLI